VSISDHHAALAKLVPAGLAPDGDRWQQRKSSQTRVAILDAAIECLAHHGYASITMQSIAQAANISRGAMLHHYATKLELIASVIDYTFYKRMEIFIRSVSSLSDEERVEDVAGVERYWESLLTKEFAAYIELLVASRTDRELREIFLPKAHRYDRVEREEVLRVFPEWAHRPRAYALAMDFCVAAIEGLLINRETWNDPARQKTLRDLVARVLLLLRKDAGLLLVED
jgi:AcrR family transcriptional regulator